MVCFTIYKPFSIPKHAPLPVYLRLQSFKTGILISWLKVSSVDLRRVCGWNAAGDDVLSSPSTAGPENEPYDRAWPSDFSQLIFFLSPPHTLPLHTLTSNSIHKSSCSLDTSKFFFCIFLTRLMSQHVISSFFLLAQGKEIVV